MFNIFTKNKNKDRECSLVIGADRRLLKRMQKTTGAFLVDNDNKFAYDCSASSMAPLVIYNNRGQRSFKSQCVLLYENSAQTWNWQKQDWNNTVTDVKTLLNDGRMEAVGSISQEQESDEKWERFMPVLYAAMIILFMVIVIACLSSGIFSKLGEVF